MNITGRVFYACVCALLLAGVTTVAQADRVVVHERASATT
jgi:hypothetical protein